MVDGVGNGQDGGPPDLVLVLDVGGRHPDIDSLASTKPIILFDFHIDGWRF